MRSHHHSHSLLLVTGSLSLHPLLNRLLRNKKAIPARIQCVVFLSAASFLSNRLLIKQSHIHILSHDVSHFTASLFLFLSRWISFGFKVLTVTQKSQVYLSTEYIILLAAGSGWSQRQEKEVVGGDKERRKEWLPVKQVIATKCPSPTACISSFLLSQ